MARSSGNYRLASARGFTLIELMVVVAVVGILAVLAIYGVAKYIRASKTSEAVEMLGSIRAAQEAYRSDTFSYRATVGDAPAGGKTLPGAGTSYTSFYPQEAPLKRLKMQWGAGDGAVRARWRELGVFPSAPTRYIYGCAAGTGTDTPASPLALAIGNYPSAPTGRPWYLCKAVGDLDGDGSPSEFGYSSFADDVAHTNDDE